MRISLLQQREPFEYIFEKSISNFLCEVFDNTFTVNWIGKPSLVQNRLGHQKWFCNSYLNVIYAETAHASIFEPVHREFGHSTRRWQRLFQRLYIEVATQPTSRLCFAHAVIEIFPAIPDSEYYMFVGGNNKLRLLNSAKKTVYGILKAGFSPQILEREITARKFAERLSIPIPDLYYVSPDGTWFSEAYVIGTPLNRLSNKNDQNHAALRAFAAAQKLWRATEEEISLVLYAKQLLHSIFRITTRVPLLTETEKRSLHSIAERLFRQAELLAIKHPLLTTCINHGDFQPANIVVNRNRLWVIDWEYAGRKMTGYDVLVFILNSRSPSGLAKRLNAWVKSGFPDHLNDAKLGMPDLPPINRELMGTLFLMEELQVRITENANPMFVHLGAGLMQLLYEANIWLEKSGLRHDIV